VAFAGAGAYENSFNEFRENEVIQSYGVGLRFMVMPSQRINVRLDYGRSKDDDAIYLGVMESF
jgi:hemolysin activation/secretion protein